MSYTGLGTDYGSNVVWCGSIQTVKGKLKELGFFSGTVNGTSDQALWDGAKAFAQRMGITISGGITKAFCQALDAAYNSKMEGPQEPNYGVPQPENQTTASGQQPPPAGGSGGGSAVKTTGGEDTMAPQGGWWSDRTKGQKIAIVGGSLAFLALVGVLLLSGGKKHPDAAPMTANRRRYRRNVGVSPSNVKPGDRVYWIDRFGHTQSGRVYIKEPGHVVVARKGRSASPDVVDYEEIVQVRPSASRRKRFARYVDNDGEPVAAVAAAPAAPALPAAVTANRRRRRRGRRG